MEIEIESKRNNPLLNRTEIQFIIRHEGKGTPDRELIRNELAEKLNTKKENIIVQTIHSSFGTQESTGYAKVYTSIEKAKDWERNHILKRNKIGTPAKKEEKKSEEAATTKEEQPKGEPAETSGEPPADSTPKETKEETPSTEPTKQPAESATEEKTEESTQPDDTEPDKKEEQPPAEEKKE